MKRVIPLREQLHMRRHERPLLLDTGLLPTP